MAVHSIHGLAICAGAGGIELGLRLALGFRYQTVGYVERDAYAAAVLVARMADKALDPAPVWDDISTFDGAAWRGTVDIVSSGFPCQPASHAGRRIGTTDHRWLWPSIGRILRDVQPDWVFLENVPGLLTVTGGRAAEEVFGTLASLGFDAEWDVFSATQLGAPQLRQRLFILAHRDGPTRYGLHERIAPGSLASDAGDGREAMADPNRRGSYGESPEARRTTEHRTAAVRPGPALALEHANGVGKPRWDPALQAGGRAPFPPGPSDVAGWQAALQREPRLEPAVRRGADGLASRLDRLHVLGNGVVPLVAAYAFSILAERLGLS